MDEREIRESADTRLVEIEKVEEDRCHVRVKGVHTSFVLPTVDLEGFFGPIIRNAVRELQVNEKMALVIKVLIHHNDVYEMREIFSELESETFDQKAGD